ncbi:hypothetical protein KEM54_000395 [Ascosphaera aggregata]|nr:hypothetical protein KEM54_000395 [Ascosphaera aggregata]
MAAANFDRHVVSGGRKLKTYGKSFRIIESPHSPSLPRPWQDSGNPFRPQFTATGPPMKVAGPAGEGEGSLHYEIKEGQHQVQIQKQDHQGYDQGKGQDDAGPPKSLTRPSVTTMKRGARGKLSRPSKQHSFSSRRNRDGCDTFSSSSAAAAAAAAAAADGGGDDDGDDDELSLASSLMPRKRKTADGVPARSANTFTATAMATTRNMATTTITASRSNRRSRNAQLLHEDNTSPAVESPAESPGIIPDMELVMYSRKSSKDYRTKDSYDNMSSDRIHHCCTSRSTAKPTRGELRRPSRVASKSESHQPSEVTGIDPSPLAVVEERSNIVTNADAFKFGEVNLYDLSSSTVTPRKKRLVDQLNPSPTVPAHNAHGQRLSLSSESPPPSPIKLRQSFQSSVYRMEPGQAQVKNAPIGSPQDTMSIGPKITYTRNRSYLDYDEADVFGQQQRPGGALNPILSSTSLGSPKRQPKFSALGNPYSLQSNVDEDVVTGSGTLRNIHELRRAGETARFESLVDSIFEDLQDDVSSQRNGLIQLVSKLQGEEFARRFLTHAMEKRLARIKPVQSDLVCNFLVVSAYGLLLTVSTISSSAFQACASSLLDIVTPLLAAKDDVLTVARSALLGLPNGSRCSLKEVALSMQKCRVWADDYPEILTPEILGLRCIEIVMRRDRESGEPREILPDTVLGKLIDVVVQNSKTETLVTDLHESHILELTFSVLESYTVALQDTNSTQGKLMCRLACLGTILRRLANGDNIRSRNRQIRILCIRLVLNLTNNEPAVCEIFSTPEIIDSLSQILATDFPKIAGEVSVDDIDAIIDTVILALGCFINLAELSDKFRKRVAETKRGGSRPFLDVLILIFRNGRESASEADNVEKTRFNVVLGYLSVFLCTLCLDQSMRRHLNIAFQGKGVEHLLATVEEFLKYYRKVEEDISDGNGLQGPMATFITRLQGIVNRVRDSGSSH